MHSLHRILKESELNKLYFGYSSFTQYYDINIVVTVNSVLTCTFKLTKQYTCINKTIHVLLISCISTFNILDMGPLKLFAMHS